MKRSYSETTSSGGLTIQTPLSERRRGDQYLYFILTYNGCKYLHSFHRVRVSDLMTSSSSFRRSRRRRARNPRHSHGHGYEKPQKLPKPILKLRYDRYPNFMAFFSAGSKIYMVGGEENGLGRNLVAYRNCYVFDTCRKHNPSKAVKEGRPMVYGKYHPIVLGPLHDKFYVLDWTLASNDLFEEFDPRTETWTPLPPAPIAPHEYEKEEDKCFPFLSSILGIKYRVVSQAIVGDTILLSTYRKGIYAFHVISHTWEHWSSWDSHGKARLPYYGGPEFLHGFWYAFPVTSYRLSAYDFDEDSRRFRPYRAHGVRRPSRLVKYDTRNKIVPMGERTLFIVHSGCPRRNPYPYNITVDMCKFARFRVQNGGKKHPELSEEYSATFTHKMPTVTMFLEACLVVSSAQSGC